MCGVAGIVNLRRDDDAPSRSSLIRMAAALRHRGPDEFGLYRGTQAGLAHARLAIIDPGSGQQPLANEDGSLWISFNGEIFNYVELRDQLVSLGHRFRTRSDTEVIVHAWEAWGEAAFARMNGQWALALWDERHRRLVLSRDRLGVRPLYLCRHAHRLYFASEVKALFAADAGMPRALDALGLEQTFTFWSVVPPQSVFAGIEELRPGHVRVYENGRMREQAYWQASYPQGGKDAFRGTLEDAAGAVRSALDEATSLRMLRADVPVGSYLSGGLDSSLVAALGRRHARDQFQTFSLRFEDAEYDEAAWQQLMVQQLGSRHHDLLVRRADIAHAFAEVVMHAERPLLRTAAAPLYLLSRQVRAAGIKVVLTGEGADEMFGGYDLFKEGKVRRFWARQPDSRMRPRALERLYPWLARSPVRQQALARQFFGQDLSAWRSPGFAHGTRWRTTSALKRLFSPAQIAAVAGHDVTAAFLGSLPEDFGQWEALAQDQHIECCTLLSGYLLCSQGDRMLMAHSVEGRFPFLDRNVVELANALPARYKLPGLREKQVLKMAARGLVPDAILDRTKQPYRAPDALCFTADDRPDYVDALLEPQAVAQAGVFDPAAVAQLRAKCFAAGRRNGTASTLSNTDNMALVGVLSTQLLHHGFVKNAPGATRLITLRTDVDHSRQVPHDRMEETTS